MRVKMILPALTEATSPFFRPIKYSLFPPLGLATLAGWLGDGDEVEIQDEHVERLTLDDDPDLVVIQAYITSARRAYGIADHYRRRGAHVALGGLHVTSLPEEAARHADTIFLGPGEDTWPEFLRDFRAGRPRPRYRSTVRTLAGLPPIRRDLIKRQLYLVPNSIVVSRGCPHLCDFCYKEAFFEGGASFYTQSVDDALAEIERLPGRHLYFLDDHLFGHPRFAAALFEGMRGMGRLWQAAGTVQSVLRPGLLERAVEAGLRSLFVGFETLNPDGLRAQRKHQNLGRDYDAAVRRLHELGVMVNASFVFGMDEDDESVFDRTVEWAVSRGVETATFHILTPYPGTALFARMEAEGRILHRDWDLYDTRHVVFATRRMSAAALEAGYWRAYREFYRWGAIARGAMTQHDWRSRLRHAAYAAGWKKFEPLWDAVIRTRRVTRMLPLLESVLRGFGRYREGRRIVPRVDEATRKPAARGWHVAIIMDGNGRWALARGLPRSEGHRAGIEAVRRVVEAAPGCGISTLTLYAFSADNWKRPPGEVSALMSMFERYLGEDVARAVEQGVRLSVIGRRDRLAPGLVAAIERVENETAGGARLHLRLAVDYSARQAILRAAREGTPRLDSEESFTEALNRAVHSRPAAPDVDLLIRSGGERRLSDFLLWESAYAELVFTDRRWPEFDVEDLRAAVEEFAGRTRRFGGLAEEGPIPDRPTASAVRELPAKRSRLG
jgi:undecaprenyl diphosphate synthase